jgi:hypothetical protein
MSSVGCKPATRGVFTSTNVEGLVVRYSITPGMHIKSVMPEGDLNDEQHAICYIQVLKFYFESSRMSSHSPPMCHISGL